MKLEESPIENQEAKIKRICKLLLESKDRMIKEKELLALVQNNEVQFQNLISEVYSRFEQIGYELIRTTFMEESYYLLATSGMDKDLTPQMYGILGLIFSFQKEFTRDLMMDEAREIFDDLWQEMTFLQEKGYLQEQNVHNESYLIITPIGKVLFKDILSEIALDAIFKEIGIQ